MMDRWKRFLIRLRSWEYWPMAILAVPVIIYWLYYSLRAGNLAFFTNVNPTVPTGGLFGESKWDIYQQLITGSYPETKRIDPRPGGSNSANDIGHEFSYPLIAKPDIGERGWRVEKLHSPQDLIDYHQTSKHPYLIQQYIAYPEEYSISAHRIPETGAIELTSFCHKIPLQIIGDGESSIDSLIRSYDRAFLQYDRLVKIYYDRLDEVLLSGEKLVLEEIGNHSRGSTFTDAGDRLTPEICSVVTEWMEASPDFNFGRYDIRCQSLAHLARGEGYAILEWNGVGGEPAHMYDPDYGLGTMLRTMARQWSILYSIHKSQKSKGIEADRFMDLYRSYRIYRGIMDES